MCLAIPGQSLEIEGNDPLLRSVRTDPRYLALLKKMNLPD